MFSSPWYLCCYAYYYIDDVSVTKGGESTDIDEELTETLTCSTLNPMGVTATLSFENSGRENCAFKFCFEPVFTQLTCVPKPRNGFFGGIMLYKCERNFCTISRVISPTK